MWKIFQATQGDIEKMSLEERRKYFKELMELWGKEPTAEADQKDLQEERDHGWAK